MYSTYTTSSLPFDQDTAVRVCRQAGYFEHASYLAKKYERHGEHVTYSLGMRFGEPRTANLRAIAAVIGMAPWATCMTSELC